MFGTRTLRPLSAITLFFFLWTVMYPTVSAAVAADTAPSARPAAAPPEPDTLESLRSLAHRAHAKTEAGADSAAEANQLLQHAAKLGQEQQQAEAEFAATRQHLEDHKLPDSIKQRHAQALKDYRANMQQLRQQLKDFKAAHDRKDAANARRYLKKLAQFLDKAQKHRHHQLFDPNNLPFGTPNGKTRAPKESQRELDEMVHPPKPIAANALTPGMLANDPGPTPTAADLAATEDAPLTDAIKAQATALHNNPVEIYNWVRNTVEFLPTYGFIQGADLTLQTQRGNAFDTASLLVALLRAANIPARYAYGTVQIPAAQVMNWVGGVTSPEAAQSLLGQGGIPNTAVVSGGRISAFKLEHVWVEAFVDYFPSRGAVNKAGDTWVPMDAAFKQCNYTAALDIDGIIGLDAASDINGALQTASLDQVNDSLTGVDSDYLRGRFAAYLDKLTAYEKSLASPLTPAQTFGGKTIHQAAYPILLGSLPYTTISEATVTAALPDNLRHTLRIAFFTGAIDRSLGRSSLAQTLSLPRLSGQRLAISYAPATTADAAVLQSFYAANADTLPLYLLQVKPQIKLEDTVIAEGPAIGMGAEHYLDIVVSSPSGSKRLSYSRIAGDEMVVGTDAAGIDFTQITRRSQAVPSDTATENLYRLALQYWAETDLFTRLGQSSYSVNAVRLPSVGVFSSPLSVLYRFGIPSQGFYLRRNIDIKLSQTAVAGTNPDAVKEFVSFSGILGSYLESSIQEQVFHNWQGTGLSTIQTLLDANSQKIPIYTLTAANAPTRLSRLQLSGDVLADIGTALATGYEVIVPERMPAKIVGVAGIGYQIRDPKTGAAAYRIWDGSNGGDGEGPCAERQLQPITQAIRDIVLTQFVLWLLRLIILLQSKTFPVSIPVPRPALVDIMDSVGLSALTFPATAGDDICEPIETIYGRNKDAIHDQCADLATQHEMPGFDVCVAGVNFDAISGGHKVLWEVKTENYNNAKKDFIRISTINNWINQATKHLEITKNTCAHRGFSYNFLVGDERYEPLFNQQLALKGVQPDKVVGGPSYCTSFDQ